MTDLEHRARRLLKQLDEAGLMVATAESCTGGLIAATLTEIAGSSTVIDRGFVTYSNEAKTDMLGVPADMINTHGAVSEPVAISMAEGALARSQANIAVSVTGVAGPGGGSAEKPVGTVHFGCARKGQETVHSHMLFEGMDRTQVRTASVAHAFKLIEAML